MYEVMINDSCCSYPNSTYPGPQVDDLHRRQASPFDTLIGLRFTIPRVAYVVDMRRDVREVANAEVVERE